MRPYSLDHYSAHEKYSDAFTGSVVKEPGTPRSPRPYIEKPRIPVLPSFAPRAAHNLHFGASAGHLSRYARKLVEVNGIEPMTSWLQTRRSPN